MNTKLFYKDEPLFGLDIGSSSIKVMQIAKNGKGRQVVGYGATNYDSRVIKNGAIENPKELAKTIKKLFEKDLVGEIATHRAAGSGMNQLGVLSRQED